MFSFFKSSKKSPVASPTAELQKTEETTQKNSDDFVLIGNKTPSPYPHLPARPPPPVPHSPSLNRQVRNIIN